MVARGGIEPPTRGFSERPFLAGGRDSKSAGVLGLQKQLRCLERAIAHWGSKMPMDSCVSTQR